MRSGRSNDGFSLAEMLVVLAMVALVGFVGLNGFGGSRNANSLKTITRKVQSLAALTSLRAISTGNTASLIIDVEKGMISGQQNAEAITLPGSYKLTVLTGAELVRQDGVASIDFYNDGASSGGEITIEDTNGSKQTVRIFWLTGIIEIKAGPLS